MKFKLEIELNPTTVRTFGTVAKLLQDASASMDERANLGDILTPSLCRMPLRDSVGEQVGSFWVEL